MVEAAPTRWGRQRRRFRTSRPRPPASSWTPAPTPSSSTRLVDRQLLSVKQNWVRTSNYKVLLNSLFSWLVQWTIYFHLQPLPKYFLTCVVSSFVSIKCVRFYFSVRPRTPKLCFKSWLQDLIQSQQSSSNSFLWDQSNPHPAWKWSISHQEICPDITDEANCCFRP